MSRYLIDGGKNEVKKIVLKCLKKVTNDEFYVSYHRFFIIILHFNTVLTTFV